MISIPLYTILFIYFAFVAVILIFSSINLSHLLHGGAITLVSFIFTLFIFSFTIANFLLTYNLLHSTDWQQMLVIWNNDWINLNFNNNF